MKLLALTVLTSLLSINAMAKDKTLVCMMGSAADMDIKIDQLEGNKEKLSVVLMGMDGNTKNIYVNSGYENNGLTKRLNSGTLLAAVSKTDLKDNFGGALLGAGFLSMEYDKGNQAFNVRFSANDMIYSAICR